MSNMEKIVVLPPFVDKNVWSSFFTLIYHVAYQLFVFQLLKQLPNAKIEDVSKIMTSHLKDLSVKNLALKVIQTDCFLPSYKKF